jgi:hypothetical protein
MLQSAISSVPGKELGTMQPFKGKMGTLDSIGENSQWLKDIAPDVADTLDNNLKLSGVSGRFSGTDLEENTTKLQSIAQNMFAAASAEPSIDDVMALTTPFSATASTIQRALAAKALVDREIIIQTPLRFLWQSPLYRVALPAPTVGAVLQDNMTPGLAYYLQSIACGAGDAPVTSESY